MHEGADDDAPVCVLGQDTSGVSKFRTGFVPSDTQHTDLEVDQYLESQPVGSRQVLIVLFVLMVMILDGMDLQLLGLAAPNILKDLNLTKAMLGPALAMTVVGMAFGALCGGWLGDRWGRKPTMVLALLLIGFASVAAGFAGNVLQLAVCRFVCGLGGGACFPGSATLISEWLPLRRKSLAVGIVTVGIPVGGMSGAVLVIATLAHGGWRNAFVIGGVLPVILAIAGALVLAESPSWLLSRNGGDEAVKALMRRVLPRSPRYGGRFVMATLSEQHSAGTILGRGDRRATLGLWLAFYMNVVATSGIVTWGTILLTGLGFNISVAVTVILLVNLVSVGAMTTCSVVTTRFGSRTLFLFASLSALILIAIVSFMVSKQPTNPIVAAGLVMAGGMLFMNQTLLYIIAAQAYPVQLRSTGVGLASLASRLGSTTSAAVGGAVLSLGSPLYFLFAVAFAAMLAAVGAIIINRHVKPSRHRRAGEISAIPLDV